MPEPAQRGAAAALFHTFANAVLARTLPSVRDWLRSKVGERASIEGMEIDGASVHLIDARLPLGPTAVLEVERATFAASAGDLAAGRPPLRMEAMVGRLVVPDDHGGHRFEAPLSFEGRPPETGLEWVHGVVTVRGARWSASMGRDAQAPIDGDIRVSVTSSDWALADGTATAKDATIRIEGAGRLDDPERAVERARLETDDARLGHYLDALFALAGREVRLPIPLPWTGKIDGAIELTSSGEVRADLELRTKRSSLSVHGLGHRASESLERLTVEGVVSWADLLPASMAGIVDRDESAPLMLEASASGPIDAPRGQAALTSARVQSALLKEPASLSAILSLGEAVTGTVELAIAGAGAWTAAVSLDSERQLSGTLGGALSPDVVDVLGVVALAGEPLALTGTLGGTAREPALAARLASPRVEARRGERAIAALDVDVDLRLEGARAGFRVGSGVATLTTARGERPRLELQHLDAPSAVALARFAGGDDALRLASDDADGALFALPDDASIEVDGRLEEGRFEGEVELVTPRSRLHLSPLALSADGALDGSRLRGTLDAVDALDGGLFPGPILVDRRGTAQLDAALSGAGVATILEGRLTSASLGWKFRARMDLPPIVLSAAACDIRIDAESVSLTDLEGNVFGGRGQMSLRFPYTGRTPTGSVHVAGAKEGLGRWLGAGIYSDRTLAGLKGDLALESDEGGSLVGPLRLTTPTSTLDVAVRIAPDNRVDGTVVTGALSLGDLYELMPRGGPTVVGKGELRVDATLEGMFQEPAGDVKLLGEGLTLLVRGEKLAGLKVKLTRLLARGHMSMDRVVWRELAIDGYEGRVRSQGLFGWGPGFRGLQAKLEIDDLAVGRLPKPGGGTLSELVGGRLNASLTLKQPADGRLSGKGELWIDEPRYPMLRLTAPSLEKVGLSPPSPRGTEPLMTQLRGGPEGWLFKGLSGAVHGARCDGDLVLRGDGTVLGKLDLVVEAVYLRSSTLLNLPAAALGDVLIPTTVTGHAANPDFEADVLAAFDHLVGKTRIGRGIHRAVDHVMDRLGAGARKLERASDDAAALETDILIHRIASGSADEDVYLDVLIDRGLSPDEIATRIERAREG